MDDKMEMVKKIFNRHVAKTMAHLEAGNVHPTIKQAVKKEVWYACTDVCDYLEGKSEGVIEQEI